MPKLNISPKNLKNCFKQLNESKVMIIMLGLIQWHRKLMRTWGVIRVIIICCCQLCWPNIFNIPLTETCLHSWLMVTSVVRYFKEILKLTHDFEIFIFTLEIEILLYLKRIFLPPFNTWENLFYPFYIKRVFGDSFEELIFDIAAPVNNTKKMGKNT